jgi:hypothetical protein
MKWNDDFVKARRKRIEDASIINNYLQSNYYLRPIHSTHEIMSIQEKKNNNNIKNRLLTGSDGKMGLFYTIVKNDKEPGNLIIFGYKEGGSFYIKNSGDYKDDFNGFLKLLANHNTHVIIVDSNKRSHKFSELIPIEVFIRHWNPSISTSKSNKNRINFHGSMKKITCKFPIDENIYGDSLIKQLQNLAEL